MSDLPEITISLSVAYKFGHSTLVDTVTLERAASITLDDGETLTNYQFTDLLEEGGEQMKAAIPKLRRLSLISTEVCWDKCRKSELEKLAARGVDVPGIDLG